MQLKKPAASAAWRRGISFILALLLVVTAVLAAAEEVSSSGLPSLRIELGDPDRVTFEDDELAIRDLRDLTGDSSDKCALDIEEDSKDSDRKVIETPLLDVSSDQELGFNKKKDWIGIREQARGVDCGRVIEDQSLTLRLGSELLKADLKALRASLTLNLKKDVSIDVLVKDEGDEVGFIQVQSGKSLGSETDADEVVDCGDDADSGSDNDATCEIPVEDFGNFDTLELATSNDGEWSLAGTSEFELSAGRVDCGETIEAEDEDAFAELTRLENVEGDCEPIPFALRWLIQRDSASIEFLAEKDEEQTAAFRWSVTWPSEQLEELRPQPEDEAVTSDEDPAETFAGRIPLSTQQFLPDDDEFFIDTCVGQRITDSDGNVTGLLPPMDGLPDMSDADGTQYGCWLTRSIEYLGDRDDPELEEDLIQVKETGYLEGDWTAVRTL